METPSSSGTASAGEPGTGWPGPGAAEGALGPPSPGVLRVLLVDDDAKVLRFLAQAFATHGCLTATTATAEAALDLSGLDLLRAAQGHQPRTPVVLITGLPSVDSAVFGLRHGAYDYLRKPFSMEEVRQLVQRVRRDRQRGPDPRPTPAGLTEDLDRQRLGLRGLFQIGALALRGLDPGVFVETVLDYTTQCLRADAALLLLRNDEGQVTQHQVGDTALVGQLRTLLHTHFEVLVKTGGTEPLPLTGPGHPPAALAVLLPERGHPKGILCVGRCGPHGAFLPDECELVQGYAQTIALALQKALVQEHLETVLTDTVTFFVTALETRDPALQGHSARVSLYTGEIATALRLAPEQVAVSRRAGLLHDLGKLALLDAILLKPGRLTEEESARVRRYPEVGATMLRRLRFLAQEAAAVRHHRERYDGTGYPDRLHGGDIPLAARIVGVADAFDAMTSPRPYRSARALPEAMGELRRYAGSQFDPAVVEAFAAIPPARLVEISHYYGARGRV